MTKFSFFFNNFRCFADICNETQLMIASLRISEPFLLQSSWSAGLDRSSRTWTRRPELWNRSLAKSQTRSTTEYGFYKLSSECTQPAFYSHSIEENVAIIAAIFQMYISMKTSSFLFYIGGTGFRLCKLLKLFSYLNIQHLVLLQSNWLIFKTFHRIVKMSLSTQPVQLMFEQWIKH